MLVCHHQESIKEGNEAGLIYAKNKMRPGRPASKRIFRPKILDLRNNEFSMYQARMDQGRRWHKTTGIKRMAALTDVRIGPIRQPLGGFAHQGDDKYTTIRYDSIKKN